MSALAFTTAMATHMQGIVRRSTHEINRPWFRRTCLLKHIRFNRKKLYARKIHRVPLLCRGESLTVPALHQPIAFYTDAQQRAATHHHHPHKPSRTTTYVNQNGQQHITYGQLFAGQQRTTRVCSNTDSDNVGNVGHKKITSTKDTASVHHA